MMIKGFHPEPKPLPIKKPMIILDDAPDKADCDSPEGIFALRINNTVFMEPQSTVAHLEAMRLEPWHENTTSWHYVYDTTTLRLACKLLTLTNLGTVTIRYCWNEIEIKIQGVTATYRYPVFFFCKNYGILLPGQEHRIKIWFVSEEPGYFLENWELRVCNTNFFPRSESTKLLIELRGYAFEDNTVVKERCDEMRHYITARAKNLVVKDILDYLLEKTFKSLPEPYPYKRLFLDSDMFEMNNKVCFFHQTEFDKLKALYSELSSFDKDVPWDYKIESLRNAILGEEYAHVNEYYSELKESFAKLLKPFDNTEDLAFKKYRTCKLLLKKFANLFETESARLKHSLQSYDSVSRFRVRSEYELTFFTTMGRHLADTVEAIVASLQSINVYDHLEFSMD